MLPVLCAVVVIPLLFLSVAFAIGVGTYSSSPVVTNAPAAERAKFMTMFIAPLVASGLAVAAWGILLFRRSLRWQIVYAAIAVVLAGATPLSWFPLGFV
ncbi:hypothetical protein GCM10027344_26730 [Spelaeicoccus albus]